MLEGRDSKGDVVTTREVEGGELMHQPSTVEAGDGKRISCQCRRADGYKHGDEIVKTV